jgi:hypothetical protein
MISISKHLPLRSDNFLLLDPYSAAYLVQILTVCLIQKCWKLRFKTSSHELDVIIALIAEFFRLTWEH